MNDTAALIESDVIGKDARHLNGDEGVLKLHAIEIAALERGANFGFLDTALSLQSSDAIGGKEQYALFGFDDGVLKIGMKGERAIVRNGPGRSCPNDGAHIAPDFRSFPLAATDDSKLDPD